jgi:hypothetical protein
MARPESLVPGNCYFQMGFADRDTLVPLIMTLVYVGRRADVDGTTWWLFRDYSGSPDPEDEEGEPAPETDVEGGHETAAYGYLRVDDGHLHSVLDFDGVARRLREIATFHPVHPVPKVAVEPPTDVEFMPIPAAVERALYDPDCVSVTMTIRFTDDGVSVGRVGEGCRLTFFTQPIFDPDEDARVRALFSASGESPTTDYPANRGRTRVLAYTMPCDRDAVVARCRQVFEEVHRIRKGDVIECHVFTRSDLERMRAES